MYKIFKIKFVGLAKANSRILLKKDCPFWASFWALQGFPYAD